MATRTHDVVATIGEYKNNQGEVKKRYTNVGSGFTDDQGRISLKLDTVPVSPEWSGWLSLYPIKDRDQQEQQRRQDPQRQQQRPAPSNHSVPSNRPNSAPADDYGDEDDIPF